MKKISEKEAVSLLKKYAPSADLYEIILKHSRAVQKVAVRIASKCSGVDVKFVSVGSLLHDIGRFKTGKGKKGIRHPFVGAEILRSEGLDEKYALVCERHIGAGISKSEIIAQNLDLPSKDFIPLSKEEKIIGYADNLIFGTREGTFSEVVSRFRAEFGEESVKRLKKLKEDVDSFMS